MLLKVKGYVIGQYEKSVVEKLRLREEESFPKRVKVCEEKKIFQENARALLSIFVLKFR